MHCSVSCILNISESGGILYLSFCNLLFSLNILLLRIIRVDADRKLNIISDSGNIPAHWGNLAKSTRHFMNVPGSRLSLGCLDHPFLKLLIKILPTSWLVRLGLVSPAVPTAATHQLAEPPFCSHLLILRHRPHHGLQAPVSLTLPVCKEPTVWCQMRKGSHTLTWLTWLLRDLYLGISLRCFTTGVSSFRAHTELWTSYPHRSRNMTS